MKWTKIILLPFFIFFLGLNSINALASSMEELRSIENQLNDLERSLHFLIKKPGFSSDTAATVNLKIDFETAKKAFEDANYLESIYFFDFFLKNIKNFDDFKEEVFQSYESLAKASSKIKNYRQSFLYYIDALKNIPKDAPISFQEEKKLSLIKSIYHLAAEHPYLLTQISKQKIIPSFLSLIEDGQINFDLLFWSAKIAVLLSDKNTALKWLSNAALHNKNSKKDAKAFYFKALIFISMGKMDEAHAFLNKAISENVNSGEIKDLCFIARARIKLLSNDIKGALSDYLSITKDSPYQESIKEELVLSYLKLNDLIKAYTLASFVKKEINPDLFFFQPYLAMKAYDFDKAKNLLTSYKQEILHLQKEIYKIKNIDSFEAYSKIKSINSSYGHFLTASPLFEKIVLTEEKIDELLFAASNQKNSLDIYILNLSQIQLKDLRPDWENEILQIKTILYKIMQVSHQLSSYEYSNYEKDISLAHEIKLKQSFKIKDSLIKSDKIYQKKHESWKNRSVLWQSLSNIIDLENKIYYLKSNYIGIKRYYEAFDRKSSDFFIQNLEKKLAYMEEKLTFLKSKLEINEVLSSAEATDIFWMKSLITDFSDQILKEKDIFDHYKDNKKNIADHIVHIKTARLWPKIIFLIGEVLKKINSKQKDISTKLEALTRELVRMQQLAKSQEESSHLIYASFTKILELSMPKLIEHYIYHLDLKLAQLEKWKVDIKIMETQDSKIKDEDQASKLALKKQDLDFMMELAKRGIKWQLPENL